MQLMSILPGLIGGVAILAFIYFQTVMYYAFLLSYRLWENIMWFFNL